MILREYNEDEEEEDFDSHDGNDSDEAPELITSRDDFDSMVNTFLNDFEILGRKMKPKMEGESGIDKLDIYRRTMGQDERNRLTDIDAEDDVQIDDLFPEKDNKDRWDCETILSKCYNLFFSSYIVYFPKPLIRISKIIPGSSVPGIPGRLQRLSLIAKLVSL